MLQLCLGRRRVSAQSLHNTHAALTYFSIMRRDVCVKQARWVPGVAHIVIKGLCRSTPK